MTIQPDSYTHTAHSENDYAAATLRVPTDAKCLNCGYSLLGLTVPRCPECGNTFNSQDPDTYFQGNARNKRIAAWFGLTFKIFAGCFLILVLLAAIIPPITPMDKNARIKLTQSQINRSGIICSALKQYKLDTGAYPTTAQGLAALFVRPSDDSEKWKGPYLEGNLSELTDPWGTPFYYESPSTNNPASYDLWSAGPNKTNDRGRPVSDDIENLGF